MEGNSSSQKDIIGNKKGKRHPERRNENVTYKSSSEIPIISNNNSRKSKSRNHQFSKSDESVSHLLNFSFPQRVHDQPTRRKKQLPVFRKELFVLASIFKFVLVPGFRFSVDLNDPDKLCPWENISFVIHPFQDGGTMICPICLDIPIAPRLSKCGHVFCFACIVTHIRFNDPASRWRKCPVCVESVYLNSLKPIKFCDGGASAKVGVESEFHLVRNGGLKFYDPKDVGGSRYCVATLQDVEVMMRDDLESLLKSDDGYSFLDFCTESITAALKDLSLKTFSQPTLVPPGDLLFYKLPFTNTYLDTLDLAVLRSIHGSYSDLPTTLKICVDSVSYTPLSLEMRSRIKYLGDLALGTVVGLVQCAWDRRQNLDQTLIDKLKKRSETRKREKLLEARKVKTQSKSTENSAFVTDFENLLSVELNQSREQTESSFPSLGNSGVVSRPTSAWGLGQYTLERNDGWGDFEIPSSLLDPATGKKRRKIILLENSGGRRIS